MKSTSMLHPSHLFWSQEVDDEQTRSSEFCGAAGVAAVVATAALVITSDDEPKTAGQALEHTGMVTGTVWVANEDGASLTAIDAGQNKQEGRRH